VSAKVNGFSSRLATCGKVSNHEKTSQLNGYAMWVLAAFMVEKLVLLAILG